jgi:hypothetical protein
MAGIFSATTSREDAESVRNLDTWRPVQNKSKRERQGGSKKPGSSIKLERKIIAPPPTERLWLNLPENSAVFKMKGGRKVNQSKPAGETPSSNKRNEVWERKKRERSQQDQRKARIVHPNKIHLPSMEAISPIKKGRSSKRQTSTKKKKSSLQGLKNNLIDKLYQQSTSLRQVFRKFDADGSGCLSRQEFRDAVQQLGFNPKSRDVEEILDVVDRDGNDNIDLAEFAAGFQGKDMNAEVDKAAEEREKIYKHAAQRSSLGAHMGIRESAHTTSHKPKQIVADRNKSIIIPLTLQKKQMSAKSWDVLQTQKKILSQLYARTSDNNGRARRILEAFRSCVPSEFGVITKGAFHQKFGVIFGLNKVESNTMFGVGDPMGSGELNYSRFRTIFDPVDLNSKALEQPKFRPEKARGEFADRGPGLRLVGGSAQDKNEQDRVLLMPRNERQKYLLRMRIRGLLDARRHEIEPLFRLHTNNKTEAFTTTKLPYDELINKLNSVGVTTNGMDADTLRNMYKGYADKDGITFSEFYNGSQRYFQKLGHSETELKKQEDYLKLHDIYGRRLGRRKVGTHACSGKAYISNPGFLAHDDGRLGIAEVPIESLSPLKRREAERLQEQKRHDYQVKKGTLKFHEPLPAGASTKWDTYQLVTGTPPLHARKDGKRGQAKAGAVVAGTELSYDRTFSDDPLANQWKSRWLEKNIEDRKKKRNKLAHSGFYTKMNDATNMFSLMQADSYGSYTQRANDIYFTGRETERETGRETRRTTGRDTLRERHERKQQLKRVYKSKKHRRNSQRHQERHLKMMQSMSNPALRRMATPFALDE